jgi:hypothetical protein
MLLTARRRYECGTQRVPNELNRSPCKVDTLRLHPLRLPPMSLAVVRAGGDLLHGRGGHDQQRETSSVPGQADDMLLMRGTPR